MNQVGSESSNADIITNFLNSALGGNLRKTDNFVGECFFCKQAVNFLRKWMKNGWSKEQIGHYLKTHCSFLHIETKDVCHGVVDIFKDVVLEVLANSTLESSEVCEVVTKLNCSGHLIPSMEWTVNIPKSQAAANSSHKGHIKPRGQPLKVLHLTDIHVDFKYKPRTKVDCNEPLCCRSGSPWWLHTSAGFWATLGKCDIPTWTLENLFQKLSEEKFDYILWTGDLLSHNIWDQTKEEQVATLHYLVDLFDKYFPDTPVYPALGNHEGIPVNNFPQHSIPVKEPVSWLYEEMAESFGHRLPEDVRSTLIRGGYYSVLVAPKFRIVSLNMNFCNNFNWWLLLNSTDPESELTWLVSILQKAEQSGEKVQIIGHIPPGLPDCLKSWSWNYYRIINRYKETVAAQIFGHFHYDSFELFYDTGYQDVESQPIGEPIGVAYISPSVTTFSDLNPGYRVFDVDGFHENSSWSVLDHHTYIMDVKSSKKHTPPSWNHEYSAKETYGLESLSPKDWEKAIINMKTNDTLFKEYYKFYYKSNPKSSCNSSCKKMMLCNLVSGRSYDDGFCNELYKKSESVGEESSFGYDDYARWYNSNKLC